MSRRPLKDWHPSESPEKSGGPECTGKFQASARDAKTGRAERYRCAVCGLTVHRLNFRLYGLKP